MNPKQNMSFSWHWQKASPFGEVFMYEDLDFCIFSSLLIIGQPSKGEVSAFLYDRDQ